MEPEKPFQESQLESAEYRDRLMKKLNCLIAVLEVAQAKVRRSLHEPEPDVERLRRIQVNLTSTLEVCRRARRALHRREAERDVQERDTRRARRSRLPRGARSEMSSAAEHARFDAMGRIKPREILDCNLEELSRLLQE